MGVSKAPSNVVLLDVLSKSFSASEAVGSLISAPFPALMTDDDERGSSASGLAITAGECCLSNKTQQRQERKAERSRAWERVSRRARGPRT